MGRKIRKGFLYLALTPVIITGFFLQILLIALNTGRSKAMPFLRWFVGKQK